MRAKIKELKWVGEYMRAGNAVLILVSTRINAHYSLRIKAWKNADTQLPCFFVELHTTWTKKLGMITYNQKKGELGEYVLYLTKCELEPEHPAIRALGYLLHCLNNDIKPTLLDACHNGYCARCGRELKDPDSIEIGLGPTCLKLV